MAPLYEAVAHGCAAGRHQEALDEVYWRRIQRGPEHFNWHKLGAFGADLAALSGFFNPPWRRPVAGLREAWKAWVLSEAAFDLRALGRLAEAVAPMQAGLEADLAREDWQNAAHVAGNLSQLHLTQGAVERAVAAARQAVALADRSGEAFWRLATRTDLADALHQAGGIAEAETLFAEAEAMQAEWQPEYRLLYSLQGFQYCDLLLGLGEVPEVKARAAQTLDIAQRNHWLLDIALDQLSLGRALLREAAAGNGDLSEAEAQLDRAVAALRQAGRQDYIPFGLLARAALHRLRRDIPAARRDLEAVLALARRGGMALHETDAHLEYARLCLAEGNRDQAREHFKIARSAVARLGYHRRDPEVAELARQLG